MNQAAARTSYGKTIALAEFLERRALWWSTFILLLMFGLALTSMAQKAPTFDEQGFIVRGLAYLRGYPQIRVGHPLGLNALSAAFMAADEGVKLPVDDPSWSSSSFHRPAELFLWETGNSVEHIMFLSRLPTIWLGILLAALAGRWAWQISKLKSVGLLALLFIALDPNVLANSRLATTDLGLTTFALLAAYTLWRFLSAPSWRKALLAGVAFGLLQNTKFNAALFVPLFGIVIVIGLIQQALIRTDIQKQGPGWINAFPWSSLLMLLIAYPLTALATLWAANGFNISTLPADLPLLQSLAGKTLPLAHYLEQLLDIGGRMQVGTPSFLLGEYSDSGWWYYFPVTFLLKTPLPTLILLAWGLVASIICWIGFRHRGKCLRLLDSSALLIPGAGFFLIALTTDINLGYRHILPVVPFFVVFAAAAVANGRVSLSASAKLIAGALLSIWLVVISLIIYPDYLAFFNFLAGGPDNGWRSLVDSNLDWGQDLDDLPRWMAENGVETVWLSYFGEGRPGYYGIAYKGLDSIPPRLMHPDARPFAPFDPAPGTYAISATNLQGVHFANHDQFSWFRERKPLGKLGYSIFIYQVQPYGEPATLLLSGVQMDEISSDDYALMQTNDVTGRWFDLGQSLLIPAGSNVWLAFNSEQLPPAQLSAYLDGKLNIRAANEHYTLAEYQLPELSSGHLAEFVLSNGRVQLQDMRLDEAEDGKLTLTSRWLQQGDAVPLKIFVHASDPTGQIVAQWDGLGAYGPEWLRGDTLVQVHTLTLPDHLPLESVEITLGVYDPENGQRWLTADGSDHIQLQD